MKTKMLTEMPTATQIRDCRKVRDLASEFPLEAPALEIEMLCLDREHGVRLRCVAAVRADGVLWFMCFDETSLLRSINNESDSPAKAAWVCVERPGVIH